MKPIRSAIILAICSASFVLPQVVSASWGTVFDPTRFGKNVLIYEEKLKEYGMDTKVYANMILKIAKLAGADTAKNETLQHLEDYVNNPTNPLDLDNYIKDYTDKTLGTSFSLKDITLICDGDKEMNAKLLEAMQHDTKEQSKLEKTVSVILELQADGTLGEIEKGNFLEGLSTVQKLQKGGRIIQKINKTIQAQQSKKMQEDAEHIEAARLSQMKVVDPYVKDEKEQKLYEEAVEKLPDAFGEKGYKTSNFGYMQF